MDTTGYFAFVTGTPFPLQCTPLPDKTGGAFSAVNRQYARDLYERFCLEPANAEYVYICTVAQIERSKGKNGNGLTDFKGRRMPVQVLDAVTPESYAKGKTVKQLTDGDTIPAENDEETTGENRPDWQYYTSAIGGVNVHTLTVTVHRDRDMFPDE